ncbi:hypothetical protein CLOM_g5905, partial [Closterium sp. NIES-68]
LKTGGAERSLDEYESPLTVFRCYRHSPVFMARWGAVEGSEGREEQQGQEQQQQHEEQGQGHRQEQQQGKKNKQQPLPQQQQQQQQQQGPSSHPPSAHLSSKALRLHEGSIDPHRPICAAQLRGQCADARCRLQHLLPHPVRSADVIRVVRDEAQRIADFVQAEAAAEGAAEGAAKGAAEGAAKAAEARIGADSLEANPIKAEHSVASLLQSLTLKPHLQPHHFPPVLSKKRQPPPSPTFPHYLLPVPFLKATWLFHSHLKYTPICPGTVLGESGNAGKMPRGARKVLAEVLGSAAEVAAASAAAARSGGMGGRWGGGRGAGGAGCRGGRVEGGGRGK